MRLSISKLNGDLFGRKTFLKLSEQEVDFGQGWKKSSGCDWAAFTGAIEKYCETYCHFIVVIIIIDLLPVGR